PEGANREKRLAGLSVRGPLTLRSARLVGVGGDLHLHDLVGIADRAALARAALDRVDRFHAGGDLAPDRVFAVEERRRLEADEELAVAAVRIVGACHADRAAQEIRRIELGLELLARAAGAVA